MNILETLVPRVRQSRKEDEAKRLAMEKARQEMALKSQDQRSLSDYIREATEPQFRQDINAPVGPMNESVSRLLDMFGQKSFESNPMAAISKVPLDKAKDVASAYSILQPKIEKNPKDELLSVQEAMSLGVPYGTTRGGAFGKIPQKDANSQPPAGYRWKADGSLEPIPGSKPAVEVQDALTRSADAKKNSIDRATRVITKIDEILPSIDWNSSGMVGSLMKNVGGTDAYDLESDVETIQAILGFKELQEMREASKSGGALGQVAVRELDLLQSTLASMKTGQSPAQLKKNLNQVKTHFTNWLDAMGVKLPKKYASPEAVKEAVARKEITVDQGKDIVRRDFGFQ